MPPKRPLWSDFLGLGNPQYDPSRPGAFDPASPAARRRSHYDRITARRPDTPVLRDPTQDFRYLDDLGKAEHLANLGLGLAAGGGFGGSATPRERIEPPAEAAWRSPLLNRPISFDPASLEGQFLGAAQNAAAARSVVSRAAAFHSVARSAPESPPPGLPGHIPGGPVPWTPPGGLRPSAPPAALPPAPWDAREARRQEVLQALASRSPDFFYHMHPPEHTQAIANEGVVFGGFTRGRPILEHGYGNHITVTRAADMPPGDLNGADFRAYSPPIRPFGTFSLGELGFNNTHLSFGGRADELGAFREPADDVVEAESPLLAYAAQQAYGAVRPRRAGQDGHNTGSFDFIPPGGPRRTGPMGTGPLYSPSQPTPSAQLPPDHPLMVLADRARRLGADPPAPPRQHDAYREASAAIRRGLPGGFDGDPTLAADVARLGRPRTAWSPSRVLDAVRTMEEHGPPLTGKNFQGLPGMYVRGAGASQQFLTHPERDDETTPPPFGPPVPYSGALQWPWDPRRPESGMRSGTYRTTPADYLDALHAHLQNTRPRSGGAANLSAEQWRSLAQTSMLGAEPASTMGRFARGPDAEIVPTWAQDQLDLDHGTYQPFSRHDDPRKLYERTNDYPNPHAATIGSYNPSWELWRNEEGKLVPTSDAMAADAPYRHSYATSKSGKRYPVIAPIQSVSVDYNDGAPFSPQGSRNATAKGALLQQTTVNQGNVRPPKAPAGATPEEKAAANLARGEFEYGLNAKYKRAFYPGVLADRAGIKHFGVNHPEIPIDMAFPIAQRRIQQAGGVGLDISTPMHLQPPHIQQALSGMLQQAGLDERSATPIQLANYIQTQLKQKDGLAPILAAVRTARGGKLGDAITFTDPISRRRGVFRASQQRPGAKPWLVHRPDVYKTASKTTNDLDPPQPPIREQLDWPRGNRVFPGARAPADFRTHAEKQADFLTRHGRGTPTAPPAPQRPTTTTPIKLSGTSPYLAKDQAKADRATKFIGRGSPASSTAAYARDYGTLANSGTYSASDRVFISAEGARGGRLPVDTAEIMKAVNAGATIITDDAANRSRSYNVGEREVATLLTRAGYHESSPGTWTRKPAANPGTIRDSRPMSGEDDIRPKGARGVRAGGQRRPSWAPPSLNKSWTPNSQWRKTERSPEISARYRAFVQEARRIGALSTEDARGELATTPEYKALLGKKLIHHTQFTALPGIQESGIVADITRNPTSYSTYDMLKGNALHNARASFFFPEGEEDRGRLPTSLQYQPLARLSVPADEALPHFDPWAAKRLLLHHAAGQYKYPIRNGLSQLITARAAGGVDPRAGGTPWAEIALTGTIPPELVHSEDLGRPLMGVPTSDILDLYRRKAAEHAPLRTARQWNNQTNSYQLYRDPVPFIDPHGEWLPDAPPEPVLDPVEHLARLKAALRR